MSEEETSRALDAAITVLNDYGYEYVTHGIMLEAIAAYHDALVTVPSTDQHRENDV